MFVTFYKHYTLNSDNFSAYKGDPLFINLNLKRMKKTTIMLLSVVMLSVLLTFQTTNAQDKTEKWPGVTVNVLTENEHVKISEITFAPGAVADWHSHPQHAVYAVTDMKMEEEVKGKEAVTKELKAGQAIWSPAVTHKTKNTGNASYTVIVTDIK